MMRPGYRDYTTLHFIILIWGFTSILGVLISVNAPMLVFYRTALAAVLMVPVLLWGRQQIWPGWQAVLQMMIVGSLIAIHWYLFFVAARVTNVSACLAGISTGALWTSFLEPLITRRPFRWFEPLLALLAVIGLYLIFLFQFDKILGVLLGVVSAMFAALFSVFNSIFSKKHHHQVVTFFEMIGASVFCVVAIGAFAVWPQGQLFDKPFLPNKMDVFYLLLPFL
jgi:drug/metabolite transporter (DMT)-like permease